jgi:hypothetical protein
VVDRSAWMDEVVGATGRAAQLVRGSAEGLQRRGAALPTTEDPDGTGWFRVAMRVTPSDLDRMDGAVLAPKEGPDEESYVVVEAVARDGAVYVRAPGAESARHLHLHMPQLSPKRLLEALKQCLETLPPGSLAERVGERRLDPIPASPTPDGDYNDAQRRAMRACLAPGLQVVWGPPGTGKTHVIVGAVQEHLRAGQRVLLVSNTNVAVDNALQRLVDGLGDDLEPGHIVRVGTPRIDAVASDRRVALAAVVEDRFAVTRAKIEDLAAEVLRLRGEESAARGAVEEAKAELVGFDRRAYAAAVGRRHNRDLLGTAQQALERERAVLAGSEAARDEAAAGTADAAFTSAVLDERLALDKAENARRERDGLEDGGRLRHLLASAARRRAEANLETAISELDVATRTRRELQDALGTQAPEVVAPPPSSLEFRTMDIDSRRALAHAEEVLQGADAQVAAAQRLVTEREATVATAGSAPQPTPDDDALVERADRDGLPAREAALPDLERAVVEARARREQAERAHAVGEGEADKERKAIERRVVGEAQVVATTLTMLTVRGSLRDGRYDHVIVDEAAAASLAQLTHAVGLATSGACLLGDYFQNGPIANESVERAARGDRPLADLFLADCFRHFDLTRPDEARRRDGCVVLTEQHRFGAALTELANRTCYSGVLTCADDRVPCDIVVLDVDGLGSTLAQVRRDQAVAGRWPIGALVARALGDYHTEEGRSVGVVVPYRPQEQATIHVVDESDLGTRVEVGTSHAFQGREFDVVVFDTVEDGRKAGWVAQASRTSNPWRFDGLRLFNVAATRARRTLYVVVNGGALERAESGPLAALSDLVKAGQARRLSVRELLGLASLPQRRAGSEDEVAQALARFIKHVGTYDQNRAIDALRERIDGARSSVWVWSPWVGRHAVELQDALVRAQARGVRVRLVALPEEDLTAATVVESLRDLRERLPDIVYVHRMHQKLVVVDEQRTFLGSMNVLSYARLPSGRRQETVFEMDSAHFAKEVLWHERADELFTPATCPECDERMWKVRHYSGRGGTGRGWWWRCGSANDDLRCEGRRKLPPSVQDVGWKVPEQRNQ